VSKTLISKNVDDGYGPRIINNFNNNFSLTNSYYSNSTKSYDEFYSCSSSNKNEPYDQLKLLGSISSKIRNDRPSDLCVFINSQYVDGKYVVRFSMPQNHSFKEKLKNAYFEVSKIEFQKLLID
jgi:hypothetical protein